MCENGMSQQVAQSHDDYMIIIIMIMIMMITPLLVLLYLYNISSYLQKCSYFLILFLRASNNGL